MGLYDVAMIKDNHKLAAGSLTAAYEAIATAYPDVPIQVEVTTTDEALEAVAAGARFIMCDNMSTDLLRRTVEALEGTGEEVEVEATGGLTLEVARAYAETGRLPQRRWLTLGPILDIALDLSEPDGNDPIDHSRGRPRLMHIGAVGVLDDPVGQRCHH
jgi:nicotinate-nucleotide pyrophosphorylase (carboxylating)